MSLSSWSLIERTPPPRGGFFVEWFPNQVGCCSSAWVLFHRVLDLETTQQRNPPGRKNPPPGGLASARFRFSSARYGWQKMRNHVGTKIHKNREIVIIRAVGVLVHRDCWLGVQMSSVLEPNTNASRILFLSHRLHSALFARVCDCCSLLCIL